MATIAEENGKILRKALKVMTGMDIPAMDSVITDITDNYPGSSETVNNDVEYTVLMDLANGGFLNDGVAQPLDENVPGIVSQINTPLSFLVAPNISQEEYPTSNITVIGFVGTTLTKWVFEAYHPTPNHLTFPVVINPQGQERIRITRVVVGESFWYDNSSLISCNLQLRAVETKSDNPELQMSEIEIEGYEPEDITDTIGYIGTGYPIYYTAGYPGDMSPVRKFYLGEPIDYDGQTVNIKGYDATYLLDDDFVGLGVNFGAYSDEVGMYAYTRRISEMLTAAGVEHQYIEEDLGEFGPDWFADDFFIEPQPKRSVIAQAVNIFRLSTGYYPFPVNYTDAGIPVLRIGTNPAEPVTLENISKPIIIIDPVVKTVNLNLYDPIVQASSAIETVDVQGAAIFDTTDPYYSFTSASGTITYLSPYSYKLEGNGSIAVSGRKIELYAAMKSGSPLLPMTETTGTNGIEIDLGNNYLFGNYRYEGFHAALQYLLQRSNISYEFEYRGDPKLQPRDYIRADIDGSGALVDLTIDTIELKHEGGGTSSTIVARRGFI